MVLWTVYDAATGTIRRHGVAPSEAEALMQAAAGEAVLIGVKGCDVSERVDIAADPPVLVPIEPT